MKYARVASVVLLLLGVHPAQAQQTRPCRLLCTPEFKVETPIKFTNLLGSHRTIAADGAIRREPRETECELILSLGLQTRLSWLEFTVEAMFLPFNADSTPELEFETNFVRLPAQRTRHQRGPPLRGRCQPLVILAGVRSACRPLLELTRTRKQIGRAHV